MKKMLLVLCFLSLSGKAFASLDCESNLGDSWEGVRERLCRRWAEHRPSVTKLTLGTYEDGGRVFFDLDIVVPANDPTPYMVGLQLKVLDMNVVRYILMEERMTIDAVVLHYIDATGPAMGRSLDESLFKTVFYNGELFYEGYGIYDSEGVAEKYVPPAEHQFDVFCRSQRPQPTPSNQFEGWEAGQTITPEQFQRLRQPAPTQTQRP